MKTIEQFKQHLLTALPGKTWTEDNIQKAFKLAASLSPQGTDSAVPTQLKEPASPGTDITNLDTVHAAIQGLGDLLKKSQEAQEKYYSNFDAYRQKDHEYSEKILGKLVGQPKEDEKDDLKPGDPTYHDPNSNVHDPKMLAELLSVLQSITNSQKNISEAQKASSDIIFSLTGMQV